MPPPYLPGAPHRQHLPLPHYLQPPRQAQTHTQTHTPTPIAVTYPHGSAKSHTSRAVPYTQFYVCSSVCAQLHAHSYSTTHTRTLPSGSWLTAGGGRRSSPDPQGGPLCAHLRPRLVARTLISLESFLHVTRHLG